MRASKHRVFARLYFVQRIWEPAGLARHRRAVAYGVKGATMEAGVGTGFSLKYYQRPPLVALDASLAMVRRARRRAQRLGHATCFVVADATALPFRDEAFDTVVSQALLCSVRDPGAVARELRRVLDRDGQYRFVEHGVATRPVVRALQRVVAPLWAALNGGCRLDRDPVQPIVDAGLLPTKLRQCSAGTVRRGTFHAPERVRVKESP